MHQPVARSCLARHLAAATASPPHACLVQSACCLRPGTEFHVQSIPRIKPCPALHLSSIHMGTSGHARGRGTVTMFFLVHRTAGMQGWRARLHFLRA